MGTGEQMGTGELAILLITLTVFAIKSASDIWKILPFRLLAANLF